MRSPSASLGQVPATPLCAHVPDLCHPDHQSVLGLSPWLERNRSKGWCCYTGGSPLLWLVDSRTRFSPRAVQVERSGPRLSCYLGMRLCRGWSRDCPLPYLSQYFSLHLLFFCSLSSSCGPVAAVVPPGWARGALSGLPSLSTDCCPRNAPPGSPLLPLTARLLPRRLLRCRRVPQRIWVSGSPQPYTPRWVSVVCLTE